MNAGIGKDQEDAADQQPQDWPLRIAFSVLGAALLLLGLSIAFFIVPIFAGGDGIRWPAFLKGQSSITEWLLVFLTLAYVVVSFHQWRVANKSLALSRDTAQRELRAYVSIQSAQITEIASKGPLVAHVVAINSGKTPAYRLRITAGMKFPEPPVDSDLTDPLDEPQSINDLGPGQPTMFFRQAPEELSDAAQSAILAGTAAIYVYGLITYDDAFGAPRFVKFQYMVGGDAGVHGTHLAVCNEGNHSN